jgi:hypothetical protein
MDQATPANIFITSTCLAQSSKIINRLFLPALQSLRNTPRSKSRVHQVGFHVHSQNVFEDISAIEFFSDQDPAEALSVQTKRQPHWLPTTSEFPRSEEGRLRSA